VDEVVAPIPDRKVKYFTLKTSQSGYAGGVTDFRNTRQDQVSGKLNLMSSSRLQQTL
jgi:hypothetical protein